MSTVADTAVQAAQLMSNHLNYIVANNLRLLFCQTVHTEQTIKIKSQEQN